MALTSEVVEFTPSVIVDCSVGRYLVCQQLRRDQKENVSPRANKPSREALDRVTYMCGRWSAAAYPCREAEKDKRLAALFLSS